MSEVSRPTRFFSLQGLIPYAEGLALQKTLVELRAGDRIPDTILFLEHEPVITRGRGLQAPDERKQMPLALADLPPMIEYHESERGGDLTYHGPGQLVIYPIVKLDGRSFGPDRDIGAYLRKIEKLIIDAIGSFGLAAKTKKGATGVWVGEHKLASIGIAVKKWVCFHGVAINVVNHLAPFHLFSPCGFDGNKMTRLLDVLPEDTLPARTGDAWRPCLEELIAACFGHDHPGIARVSRPYTEIFHVQPARSPVIPMR